MEVNVVAQHGGGDHRIVLVELGQFSEGIVRVAVDDRVFFDPANLVFLGFYLEETTAVLQHLKLLAIVDLGYAVGDSGYPVMQIHLARGNVDGFVLLMANARTAASQREEDEGELRKCRDCRVTGGTDERQLIALGHCNDLLEDSTNVGAKQAFSSIRKV